MLKEGIAAWEDTAEHLHVRLSEEYFKLEVGLPYSQKKISTVEKLSKQHAELFLQNFTSPRELYLDCVAAVAKAKTHKLLLKLHELRKTKICINNVKFNDKPVCWTSWRQFAVQANDTERKTVFDAFVKKTSTISNTINEFFEISRKVYSKYKLNPLSAYLEEHKLTLEQLRNVLHELGSAVLPEFRVEFRKYTKKFLGRHPLYFDDFYFMRNVVFQDLVKDFRIDVRKKLFQSLADLGFDPNLVKVDSADRPQKFPSPFCSFVKIPEDVRVSYKMENPLNTTVALYHEFGHALHATNIELKLPYHKKYVLSDGLTETFSVFFENLLSDEEYLVQVLELPRHYATELVKRIKFTEHFAVAFYVANSLLKIEQWEKNLSMKQMNEQYAAYLKEHIGLDVPGQYWQLHHIMPESLMYVPSYLLAMIRSHELVQLLKNEYGKWWWANKRAGEEIKAVMRPGADSSIGDFSKLDVKSYVRDL